MQRWNVIQHELLAAFHAQVDAQTVKLEKVIHILGWVRI